MKIAVIGAGYWGQKHIKEYVDLGHAVTVYDSNPEIRKKHNSFTYEEILSNPEIKAVSICTPNDTHYKIAVDMMYAGKNVLIEKPMAVSLHQAVDLVTTSKSKNLILSVGHIYRFNNAINEVKLLIPELGNIRLIKFNWTNLEPIFNGRDILYDLVPHPFDIMNYLFGKDIEILSCTEMGYRVPNPEVVFITGQINKTIVNIELSWITLPKTRRMTLVCSNKTVEVDCADQVITIYEQHKPPYRYNVKPNNTIRDELLAFIGCIEDRTKTNVADGMSGLFTIKEIEKCKQKTKQSWIK